MWEVGRGSNLFPRRSRQEDRTRASGEPSCGPSGRGAVGQSHRLHDDAAAHSAALSFKLAPSLLSGIAPTGGGRRG